MQLQDKKMLIGITGSIAAYKTILLVRLLVKSGAQVKVVMTPSAKEFVSPLVLSTLSRNEVIMELANNNSWSNHVALGRWADVMLIAPLSCNTMAKMANGICDNLLMAVYLSATCPVVLAPAMDEDMWKHPATKRNLALLKSYGHQLISVESGELASGLIGEGRMAEPETIAAYLVNFLSQQSKKEFTGKNVLITAGPTYENIDPVRFIGNHSTGKMGLAIAEEMMMRGADVTLVLGPSQLPVPEGLKQVVRVTSARQMYEACVDVFNEMDIAVMTAAVADYTPEEVETEKIKKKNDVLQLSLTKTKDILGSLGKLKSKKQVLVGFALETNNERQYAMDKLRSKNADMIVMNSAAEQGAGFGHDTNRVTIFFNNGKEQTYPLKSKKQVAGDIADAIVTLMHE